MSTRILQSLPIVLLACLAGCKGGGGGGNPDVDADVADDADATDTVSDGSGGCETPAEGCACDPGDTCDVGLVCVSGVCSTPETSGFAVSDANARSCEARISASAGEVLEVRWGAGVTGSTVAQDPHTGIAFFASSDAAFSGAVFEVVASPDAVFELQAVRCFDAVGAELAGATISNANGAGDQ
jgi:hypothetical protein